MSDKDKAIATILKNGFYPYEPNRILPIVAAVLVGLSLAMHIYQNFRYRFWRVSFFLFYAGLVFLMGWIIRAASSRAPLNLGLYIAQFILTYAAPPIYAAAEYNILGRLLYYLPQHTPINPSMVKYFFIYLGALVEGLSGAGAGQLARSRPGSPLYVRGGTLVAIAIVVQGLIECVFMALVALMHYRCVKSGMWTRNVKLVCFTLYGTSALVLVRCAFRAAEAFTTYVNGCEGVYCGSIAKHEWFLYVFEAAPMLLYSVWLNVFHPGKFLPANSKRFLDVDGKTERMGPGWIDNRPSWLIFLDPFDSMKDDRSSGANAKFWLKASEWPVCTDGSFAASSASNHGKRTESGDDSSHLP